MKSEKRVESVGNRTRYKSGVYVSTRERGRISQFEWYRDNSIYYRLKRKLGVVFYFIENCSAILYEIKSAPRE